MAEGFKRLKKEIRSLSFRLPMIFAMSGLVIMLIVVPIVYYWFRDRMIDDYSRMAQGMARMMAQFLDADGIDAYLENDQPTEKYLEIRQRLMDIKKYYPDVIYGHVLRFERDGAVVVFNPQETGEWTGDGPGDFRTLDATYSKYQEKLNAGKEFTLVADSKNEGYFLTYFLPIFDGEGKYQCHVCAAFSMENFHTQNLLFLHGMLIVFAVVLTVILVIDVLLIRRQIIRPLRSMTNCTANFAYDTEADRFRNVQTMEELNVQTHDEIEDLYYQFMSVMKESLYYMTSLNRAKSDMQEQEEKLGQISETAYKDALTSVGNQAAFNKVSEVLNKAMAEKRAEFAVVMVDVNNLKYVNDTYGHKYGDIYIKGCCNLICNVYKRSPVYRVGGDEFVVILRNEDYMSRLLRMTQVREAFKKSYGNQEKNPWERFSASVGMAECEPGDETVDQVLKRADKEMYEQKMEFKKKYGSYR
ncbi:MAG: diguanylate cyclase [Acetatifactor sp.]|nr:diguanylate cyclase [Acetatifactor sp.]